MKEKLTVTAYYEENTADKNNTDFQQYVEAIVKDWTAGWDKCEATVEVDGEIYSAQQEGNRHENDEEFVSALKGYPWHKAIEEMPPHEGDVLLAVKIKPDMFSYKYGRCDITNGKVLIATRDEIIYEETVTENLYWRYIGRPNF